MEVVKQLDSKTDLAGQKHRISNISLTFQAFTIFGCPRFGCLRNILVPISKYLVCSISISPPDQFSTQKVYYNPVPPPATWHNL